MVIDTTDPFDKNNHFFTGKVSKFVDRCMSVCLNKEKIYDII